jgi:hypothetical protein
MILVVALNSGRLETVLADSDVGDIRLDAVLVDSYMLAMRVAGCMFFLRSLFC